jgi:phosphatidylserine/phosphatidylglycerophosphate/cardiolipin synthase-like enzyme
MTLKPIRFQTPAPALYGANTLRVRSFLLLPVFFLACAGGPWACFAADLILPEAKLSLYVSQGGGAKRALIDAIDAARSNIHVHSFFLSDREIASALIRAKRRGVAVEALLCRRGQTEALDAQGRRLVRAGIPVFLNGEFRAEHNKVMIFDGRVVQTGSYNYRFDADVLDAENVLFVDSPELAAVYLEDYAQRKAKAAPFDLPPSSHRPRTPTRGPPEGGPGEGQHLSARMLRVEAEFIPGNGKESVLRHIREAQREIVVHSYYLSDPDITRELAAANERGLAGEALLSAAAPHKDPSPFLADRLHDAGVPVRLDAGHRNAHNKVIVYDRRIVQTGSYNLKKNADRVNAENILYVHSAGLARLYLAEYRRHLAHSLPFTRPEGFQR